MVEGRKPTRCIFHCTPEHPWKPDMPTPVVHQEAEEYGEQRDGWPAGDIQPMRCRTCGATWEKELPQ